MRKELVLPAAAIAGGAAGFVLRCWELRTAFEPDTGLPVYGMGATWSLILLCAALVLALALLCRGVGKGFTGGYDEALLARERVPYLAVIVAGALLMAGAGLLLLLRLPGLYRDASSASQGFSMLTLIPLALLSALCLASAWSFLMLGRNNYRGEGKGTYSAFLLFPAYTCCMWLIVSYQERSGDPVVLDYVYQLLAIITSVLGCYFLTGFGYGRAKAFPAAFFSLASLAFLPITLADAHELPYLLLYAAYFCYFAASAPVLLSHLSRPREGGPSTGRSAAGTKPNREGTPDEG